MECVLNLRKTFKGWHFIYAPGFGAIYTSKDFKTKKLAFEALRMADKFYKEGQKNPEPFANEKVSFVKKLLGVFKCS